MPSAATHFFGQRKKITKRKKSEAEMHNGNSSISSSESLHHMNAKQVPMKPVPAKAVSGKGSVMMKKPKKPIAARKPPVKKEAPQKGNSERTMINPQVIKNYDIDNMQVVNEEQGKVISHLQDYNALNCAKFSHRNLNQDRLGFT